MRDWLNAIHPPRPPSVLRLQLRPYTLGHQLFLERIENPLATGQPATLEELIQAVLVCAGPWRDAESTLTSLRTRLFAWIWGFLARRLVVEQEYQNFMAYIEAGQWVPGDIMISKDAKQGRSPWSVRLFANALQRYHLNPEQALDMPLSRLSALDFASLETEGKVEMKSEGLDAAFKRAESIIDPQKEWDSLTS